LEEEGGITEDGIGLLEFLSIGRSKEETLLRPYQQVVGTLVVVLGVLLALSRIDCLHYMIIVEKYLNRKSKNYTTCTRLSPD
jgi:hypothetical protein